MSDPHGLLEAFEGLRARLKLAAGKEVSGIRARLRVAAGDAVGSVPPVGCSPLVDSLAERCELTPFESEVIILAAFAELEQDAADLLAAAQGDPRLEAPSVSLALSILDDAHWSAFAPHGPLRRFELLEVTGDSGAVSQTLRLPERVVHHLVGVDTLDESLLLLSRQLLQPPALAKSRQAVVTDLVQLLTADSATGVRVVPQLCGAGRAEKIATAAAAAAQLGASAFLMNADVVGVNPGDRTRLARRWEREMRLSDAILVLDATDAAAGGEQRQVIGLVEALQGRVVVVAEEPLHLALRISVRLDLPRSSTSEQAELWHEALGPVAERLNGTIERMSNHFALEPTMIAVVGSEVRRASEEAGLSDPGPHESAGDSHVEVGDPQEGGGDPRKTRELQKLAWNAARSQARPRLGGLAQRVEAGSKWKDLVLPQSQKTVLRALAAQVRQRSKVYEEWGFAARSRRGLGISALFSGPSGTGKTLAAEVLGTVLGLDVYRIDLSSVVSKWIGETEKNLRRIFDAAEEGCAVLLFDEADALFGKRSDVKDSHDRYANIEVSYLLQRLEAYRGLAILTSNLKSNIDEAFLRRIRFIIEFPFPGPEQRRKIWKRAFPRSVPKSELDHQRLAQLSVTGGSIRNIAINAAFLAADGEGEVTMAHVLKAVRFEYEKTGRSVTDRELRGWPV